VEAPQKQLAEKKLNNYLQQAQFIINKKQESKSVATPLNDSSRIHSISNKEEGESSQIVNSSSSSIVLLNSTKNKTQSKYAKLKTGQFSNKPRGIPQQNGKAIKKDPKKKQDAPSNQYKQEGSDQRVDE
jgi:hypothetical protein